MKELSDSDLEHIKSLIDSIDKFQSMLAKDCVHVLKGIDPAKISLKRFDDAVASAKKASDEIDRGVKHLRKILK